MNTPQEPVKELTERVVFLEGCHALKLRVAALEKAVNPPGWRNIVQKHGIGLVVGFLLGLVLTGAVGLFSNFAASVIGALGTSGANAHSWAAVILYLGIWISTTWALVAVLALVMNRDRG